MRRRRIFNTPNDVRSLRCSPATRSIDAALSVPHRYPTASGRTLDGARATSFGQLRKWLTGSSLTRTMRLGKHFEGPISICLKIGTERARSNSCLSPIWLQIRMSSSGAAARPRRIQMFVGAIPGLRWNSCRRGFRISRFGFRSILSGFGVTQRTFDIVVLAKERQPFFAKSQTTCPATEQLRQTAPAMVWRNGGRRRWLEHGRGKARPTQGILTPVSCLQFYETV